MTEELCGALRDGAEALRVNFAGYTSEVRYTDHVLHFPRTVNNAVLSREGAARLRVPQPSRLYSIATGDPGEIRYCPMMAVRWLTPPRDIAARVMRVERESFSAQLYHFGEQARPMQAELYRLTAGRYCVSVTGRDGRCVEPPRTFTVDGPRTRVDLELPPRELCCVSVSRLQDRTAKHGL